VISLIQSAIGDGGHAVSGGGRVEGPGYFVQPTVLTGLRRGARILREEVFGPVIAATPFDDVDEVVELANDTIYGLAAAIWTRDIGRAHRLARRMRAGTVWLNCQRLLDYSMPFGGYKQSGWGRESGWEGVEAFLQTKAVYAAL
jgi:aldehyde dehydrogenase (NAD+)